MTEAAHAVVDWGFKNLGLAKIFAMADLPSQGSWRVIEKLGMTREGVLRRESIVKGQPVDDLYYGLLREEWEAGRASRPLSQSCRCKSNFGKLWRQEFDFQPVYLFVL